MKIFTTLFIYLFALTVVFGQSKIIAPNDFFIEPMGEHFYPHHLIVDYFQMAAKESPNVQLIEYGRTNEKRPLLLAFVSSEENIKNLEAIRLNNLKRAGLYNGEVEDVGDKAIVWLSYGVHGNEASSPSVAVNTLYKLLGTNSEAAKKWLDNTVIIMDPSVNPDGYSRYADWIRGVSHSPLNAHPVSREHQEPWPGGRVNHYLYDLNRDWAWCTQVESQQRLVPYRQWLPHVHVDFHEQGHESPYYFAPAAKPMHEYISTWQKEFQTEIGKNNAKYFDQEGWLYFTKERFDLLYPSYGDTYPTFNGSIGMTYEQAGHGRAGKGIELENGDTLKLMDRIAHHTATGLSTIEMSSVNAQRLIKNFTDFFKDSKSKPKGAYTSFIISGENGVDKLKSLADFLTAHGIEYGRSTGGRSIKAYNYATGKEESAKITDQDLVISAYQPMSILTQVLFEPEPMLEDSITYDITAWALPYARGLKAYASKERINPNASYDFATPTPQVIDERPYSYIFKWNSLQDATFLGALNKKDVKVRYARKAFTTESDSYATGTLVITRADNKHLKDEFDSLIKSIAHQHNRVIHTTKTGFMRSGSDFGSSNVNLMEQPKVLAVYGEGVRTNSYGQVWHYFESTLQYPFTAITKKQLSSIDLSEFNTLVLTDGRYSISEKVINWVKGGGKLIALGSANASLTDIAFKLKKKAKAKDTSKTGIAAKIKAYGDQERKYISTSIPGAIFKLTLDKTHPLVYGVSDTYFALKASSTAYEISEDLWNVGYIDATPQSVGFVGTQAMKQVKESLGLATQDLGSGQVIYFIDNPLYRSFWEGGLFLMSNALFMVE